MDLTSDLRFSFRMIRKRPGTSALAIIALGLGVGLTTLMFSIVEAAFLRGLPFDQADRIVSIARRPLDGTNLNDLPMDDYLDYRDAQSTFEDIAAVEGIGVTLSDGAGAERYAAAAMTPNALRVLRVAPALGRDFNDADAAPGAPPVALISTNVWTVQFHRDPGVVNQAVRVNGTPTVIVGVMPERFGFPQTQDVWIPKTVTRPDKRGGGGSATVFGRVKAGVSVERAGVDLAAIASRLASQYPENRNLTASVQPFVRRFIGQQVISTLYAMLGAVFGVMLIACANVMSLQMARAAERTREVAVRTALGAGRGRIVRQMLVEGLVLSAAGAALGLIIATVGNTLFNNAIAGTQPPFWIVVRIDRTVLLFVIGLTMLATISSSLLPAMRATRLDLNAVLKDEGRANTGIQMGRFSRGLVIAEVLLSCCLLIVSGLMIRSVVQIGQLQYPFATREVLFGTVNADAKRYPKDPDIVGLTDRLLEKWAALPGVRTVSIASNGPTQAGTWPLSLEGETYAKEQDHPRVRYSRVGTEYWDVLRLKVVRGRLPTRADGPLADPVIVVDEAFARKFFASRDPIGRRLKLSNAADAKWLTIVGIVPDTNVAATPGDVVEQVYAPFSQAPTPGFVVLAAAAGSPLALTSPVRAALRDVDQDLALSSPNSLEGRLWERTWAFRVFGTLFMSFGLAALVLAGAGLYGVMAFTVRRRTQEIGVRMALGADRGRVVRMVLWQGMWRVGVGVILGLVPAYFLGGAMTQLLFRVTPTDPLVIGVTIVFLLLAGAAATIVPARRAASVDPLKALRQD